MHLGWYRKQAIYSNSAKCYEFTVSPNDVGNRWTLTKRSTVKWRKLIQLQSLILGSVLMLNLLNKLFLTLSNDGASCSSSILLIT